MNSKELRKKFKPVYQEFYSKSMKVFSAPHSFLWSGDFSGFYGGLTISSKIPLRMYVGLEQISADKLEVADQFFAYFPDRDCFSPMQLDQYLKQSIAKVLQGKIKGVRVHLLSEVPLGASLGGLGAISACLACIIEKPKEKPSAKDLNDLFLKGWEIAKKLQTGRSLGATTFAALSDSKFPIAFYAEGNKYWAKPLNQLVNIGHEPVWPIDFGLIFSGKFVQGAAVIASAEEVKRISEERETKIDFRRINKNTFWEDYINFLKQIANQNLYAMTDLFQKGAHENSLKYFFNTLNQYQNLLHFLEISNPEIDRIYAGIHRIANIADNRVGSGAKITGVGKGGMVLFATSYGQYRDQIEKEYGNKLAYSSWRDACEDQGARIEQDVEVGSFSEFVDREGYLLSVYSVEKITRSFISEKDLATLEIPFVIDSYKHKIIVPGKELNSKDIPSQKSTAIILEKLLNSKDHCIRNSELPGSYATSRFDLQSKITTPVSKISGIDFEISGSMYDNYVLKLKRINSPIGIISKI